MGFNSAIIGAFLGDEAKAAVTHDLSKYYDWVIRFNGGANAGHTIYRDGRKYVHNLIPSFDFRQPNLKAFLSSGMVIDISQLYEEVQKLSLEVFNYPNVGRITDRIYVDPDAFLVLPSHKEEDKKVNAHLGSTNRGIGPANISKVSRTGKRIRDLISEDDSIIYNLRLLGVNFNYQLELFNEFKRSLFEGAQGVLLDLNHGTYPYVSCGDSTVGGICSAGFSSFTLDKVYGVVKCYATRVGTGPFPTEIFGDEAEELRKLGNEYGATTGRPRRVGWLDLPALRYAIKKSGITSLIITKFDILNGMDKVKVCVSYDKEPVSSKDFFTAKPNYIEVDGWKDCENTDNLLNFINLVEKETGIKVRYIRCGTDEKDFILMNLKGS